MSDFRPLGPGPGLGVSPILNLKYPLFSPPCNLSTILTILVGLGRLGG